MKGTDGGETVLLEDIEFIKGLSNVEQARLLGAMEEQEFPAGSIIFKQGDKGDCMYILMGGQSSYLNSPRTAPSVRSLSLARMRFSAKWPCLLTVHVRQQRQLLKKSKLTVVSLIVFSVIIIDYCTHTTPVLGLSREAMIFVGISIAAVVSWVANILPAFIVSFSMVLIWVLSGIVKPEIALSGFGTPVWFYTLGILAFGTAISKSGLLYRVSLHILKVFPRSYFGQLLGLAVCGLIFTPLIPSASAKAALGSSISQSISESMNFPDRSKGSAGMGLCAMIFSLI